MTNRGALPDLVRDKELTTTTESNLTIHHRRHGRRSIRETWKHDNVTLGQGGYGVVWRERRVNSQSDDLGEPGPEVRAVKRIHILDSRTLSEDKHYLRELEALAKFSQDKYTYHFVKFFGWYEVSGWLHMAMEYCEYGDLKRYLLDCKTLPEDQLLEITSQVLGALALMHGEGFAHRDLKPANMLIKRKPPGQWWVKLADLGLTKRVVGIVGSTTIRGTQDFMAPETRGFPFLGDPKTADPFSADMWSVGETVFRAITGTTSFENPAELLEYQKDALPFPESSLRMAKPSEALANFIRTLMRAGPMQRPSADEALQLPWIGAESADMRPGQPARTTSLHTSVDQCLTGASGAPPVRERDTTQASGQWTTTLPHRTVVEPPAAGMAHTPGVLPLSIDVTAPSGSWSTVECRPDLFQTSITAPKPSRSPQVSTPASTDPNKSSYQMPPGSSPPVAQNAAPGGHPSQNHSYYHPISSKNQYSPLRPFMTDSKPTDVADGIDGVSVTEENRIRIKNRMKGKRKPSAVAANAEEAAAENNEKDGEEQGGEKDGEEAITNGLRVRRPLNQRVPRDDNWKRPPKNPLRLGLPIPKDFLQRSAQVPSIREKMKDWTTRLETPEIPRVDKHSTTSGNAVTAKEDGESRRRNTYDDGIRVQPTRRDFSHVPLGDDGIRVRPIRPMRRDYSHVPLGDDGIRVKPMGTEVISDRIWPTSQEAPFPDGGQRVRSTCGDDAPGPSSDHGRHKGSHKPSADRLNSLADIPVGDSAFSELSDLTDPGKSRTPKAHGARSSKARGTKSTKEARKLHRKTSQLNSASLEDLLKEFAEDENLYQGELKTLVDGVLPVLLTHFVPGDPPDPRDLFSNGTGISHGGGAWAKSVVDMGISLEKLKAFHKRAPLNNAQGLLLWLDNVYPVYDRYVDVWRLGFRDIIVRLAPGPHELDDSKDSLLNAMARNEDGDVLDENGERVDVAHLLKRPLVRIKWMHKLAKGILILDEKAEANDLVEKLEGLLHRARRRLQDETARLVDEDANNTVTTRTRDLRSLAALDHVDIDQTRHVHAKDYFSLQLSHSSGQQLKCKVELVFRDKGDDPRDQGDILIRERGNDGSWLLFAPVITSNISARKGDGKHSIVAMIRGTFNHRGWYELLNLHTDDEDIAKEWLGILGSQPVPPYGGKISAAAKA